MKYDIEVGPPPIHEHYIVERDQKELCGRVVCPFGFVGISRKPRTNDL